MIYRLFGSLILEAADASDWICENAWQAVSLLIIWETGRFIWGAV